LKAARDAAAAAARAVHAQSAALQALQAPVVRGQLQGLLLLPLAAAASVSNDSHNSSTQCIAVITTYMCYNMPTLVVIF
jgi:hypothetical protein